jgi:hypothetical protein
MTLKVDPKRENLAPVDICLVVMELVMGQFAAAPALLPGLVRWTQMAPVALGCERR